MVNDPELLIQFNQARLDNRQLGELMGLAAGIIADGVVVQKEAEFLLKWLEDYAALVNDNPLMRPILIRIKEMLADNVLDDEEARELFEILQAYTGSDFELGEIAHAASLPLDTPEPDIIIPDKMFCFTGTFVFGSRKDCNKCVEEYGGKAVSLTQKTDYLVIGSYVMDTWKHASCANTIIKAAEMRDNKGVTISIVSENHWLEQIKLFS